MVEVDLGFINVLNVFVFVFRKLSLYVMVNNVIKNILYVVKWDVGKKSK